MSPMSDDEQIWLLLRERSLQSGGFGEDRARIWPALLGVQPLSAPPPYSEVDNTDEYGNPTDERLCEPVADPHVDERQIKLDTDRSFVLYPGESSATPARDALQNELHGLLVSLFRKRRSLHYFQGFHDVMTVIFLTLPRPLHFTCAEKMALHRVRDAMGVGLEPLLGLLRVLRNLLRLADPVYAELLENASPLPYHALSHLLTLFSHDIPTLPLIQHVWDFLLSREPIAVVWLAAALILYRKPSVYLLAEQDEEGMIHSLLGGMPELFDAEPEFHHMGDQGIAQGTATEVECGTESEALSGRRPSSEDIKGTPELEPPNIGEQMNISRDTFMGDEDELEFIPSDQVQSSDALRAGSSSLGVTPTLLPGATDQNCMSSPHSSTLELAASIPLPDSRPASPIYLPGRSCSVQLTMPLPQGAGSVDHHNSSPAPSSFGRAPSRLFSSDLTRPSTQPLVVASGPTSHFEELAPSKSRTKPAPLSLTYLLRQADDLLTAYPSSHPLLRVTEIMGPDSVMRTWRPLPISTKTRDVIPDKQPYGDTDDYLETLVNSSRIVIPSPPPSPLVGARPPAKKTKVSPRALRRPFLDSRRIGLRLGTLTPAERRVLFIGALLVVGTAMALKSSKVPCVDGIIRGDGLKRLWSGKWRFIPSVVAAWGRGLP